MEAYEQLVQEIQDRLNLSCTTSLVDIIAKYDIALKEKDAGKDLQQKIDMFLSVKRIDGLSPRTIEAYALQLKLFTQYIQKPVEKITTADIRLYIGQHQNLKANTINNKLVAIRTFFQFLVDEEILQRNPAVKSKIKPAKVGKRIPKALNLEELEYIRDSCKTDREKAMIEFLYSTGCRVSEVHSLNRGDLDMENQSVRVIGKGDKERIVYFTVKARILIKRYLASRKDANPALFVTDDNPHNRLSVRSMQRNVKAIAQRTTVRKNVHPHVFRHTMLTMMLENGADILTAQNCAGHESPTTTQGYAQRSGHLNAENYRRFFGQ